MGYYKKLSAGGGKRASKFDLDGLPDLYAKLGKISRFCHRTDAQAKEIHKKHARNLSRQLKRKIKPASKDITVISRDRSKPTIVEKGTYKRSIGYWVPRSSRVDHVYYIGPRTGGKVNSRRDAWFQLIVEQDKQWIKGNNRHAGVIQAFLREAVPAMEKKIIADYKKHLTKLAK
jgi:hypothetical protein